MDLQRVGGREGATRLKAPAISLLSFSLLPNMRRSSRPRWKPPLGVAASSSPERLVLRKIQDPRIHLFVKTLFEICDQHCAIQQS
ncbi:uncharacterized protein TrAFT101_009949 [Trichoderma asperellum]|uniref:uncharacterized protein n=1 Tax=Trichoderma asperellum TaxID=101201 RepID=UPI0033198C33|nr:hypothetical protein TrAFT101_009949 [Trichoderma asperellum]